MPNQVKLTDLYETPPYFFAGIHAEFRFKFDVCADHKTAKCRRYWTVVDDALSKKWSHALPYYNQYIWCNPPYSNIRPWVDKAIEAQADGLGVVMLVNADVSVGWFTAALPYVSEVRFITGGRLSFVFDGKKKDGSKFGSMLLIFNPHKIGAGQYAAVSRNEVLAKGKEFLKRYPL